MTPHSADGRPQFTGAHRQWTCGRRTRSSG